MYEGRRLMVNLSQMGMDGTDAVASLKIYAKIG